MQSISWGKLLQSYLTFCPFLRRNFERNIYFWGKWEPALLLAIKLCPISPWRNKLVWLGHIYLATELYITAELEHILLSDISRWKADVMVHANPAKIANLNEFNSFNIQFQLSLDAHSLFLYFMVKILNTIFKRS